MSKGTSSKNSQAVRDTLSLSTASQSSHSAAISTALSGNRRRYPTTSTSTEFVLPSTESTKSTESTELNEEAEGNQQGETKQDMPLAPISAVRAGTFVKNVVKSLLFLDYVTSGGLFTIIFSFLDIPENYERFLLRRMCRAFRLVLKATLPSRMFKTFPHPNYPTLDGLVEALNRVYRNDPSQAPKIVFVMEGTYHIFH
jgi:hypothetical protein